MGPIAVLAVVLAGFASGGPEAAAPDAALAAVRDAWIADGAGAAERVAAVRLVDLDGDPAARGRMRMALAWLRVAAGDRDAAEDLWTTVADPAARAGGVSASSALVARARLRECAGRFDEAARDYRDAVTAIGDPGPAAKAEALVGAGRAASRAGDATAAEQAFSEARTVLRRFDVEDRALSAAARGASDDAPRLRPCTVLPVRVAGGRPDYPEQARRERLSAWVVLRCRVEEDGTTAACEAIGGSARFRVFETAAVRALESWTWLPALDGDRPVALDVLVDVAFTIR